MFLNLLLRGMSRDPAGIALSFLRALDLQETALVSPWTITDKLGIYVTNTAQRTCRGRWMWRWWTMWVSACGTEIQRAHNVMHEIGHLACDFCGVLRPHSELLVQDVADRIWLPDRGVRRTVALAGWDVGRMIKMVGERLPALTLLRRVAETMGGMVIVRQKGERYTFAPPHFVMPSRTTSWENDWLKQLRDHGNERPVLWGVRCQNYVDPLTNRPGEVIMVPPDACELLAERPWLMDEIGRYDNS